MRVRRAHAFVFAVVAGLATGMLPCTAIAGQAPEAAPSFEVQKRSLGLDLSLEGSNGYSAAISTVGHKRVTLTLLRGGAAVVLTTAGKVSRHGIEAEFGDMGEVSVRFEGARTPWRKRSFTRGQSPLPSPFSPEECRGPKPILEAGVFRGTIDFRGENDFTRIEARSAPGTVARHYRRVCKVSPLAARFDEGVEDFYEQLKVPVLRSVAHADGATVSFQASAVDFSAIFGFKEVIGSFMASSVERRDGNSLLRGRLGRRPVLR